MALHLEEYTIRERLPSILVTVFRYSTARQRVTHTEQKVGLDMYATMTASGPNRFVRRATRTERRSDGRCLLPTSRRVLLGLFLVVLIATVGTLVPTAGYERVLDATPVEMVLGPRAAELAPGPPDVQLTSPVPHSINFGGGRGKAVAM